MIHCSRIRAWRQPGLIFLSILCLLVLPVLADGNPESNPEETPQSDQLLSPEFTPGVIKILIDSMNPVLQMQAPAAEADRGGSYTNCGEGVAYLGPNAFERAKLAMARDAVEASRAAGTLMIQMQGPPLPQRPEDLEAIKLQALRLAQPDQLDDFSPAGVGRNIPSVQNPGTALPNDEELKRTADELQRRREAQDGGQG
ncbi:MAG: hypothetical protein GY835_07495 [bacterium]|nr:hypothetical protein [bacterium]